MSLEVANIILDQLGRRKFIAMTGAKNLVGSANSLSGRLPTGFATNGANGFSVTLNERDYYDLRFFRLRGTKFTELEGAEDVDAETLRSTFERLTGLRTRL